jgi:hypothetical protein|tara:strand:+ start:107 stop:499 length:393 start_codon:yes stop_codon:yes gene_type:complete
METSLYTSKTVSLAATRGRRVPNKEIDDDDNRRDIRRASSERLFAQVVQSNDNDLVGTTLSCEAIDISANGLKISADRTLSVGCVLDLWVDDSRKPGKFFLSSDVRWSEKNEFGVQLHNGSATDIEAWRK